MKIRELHSWQVRPAEAIVLQRQLAGRVSRQSEIGTPRLIGGADISVKKSSDTAMTAVVVLQYPEMKLVDLSIVPDKVTFPYVPGLLSFREAPLVLRACLSLKTEFDLLLVDGQGIAHPRRLGLACHLGLWLDKPTIGCAKSRLTGTHEEPGYEAGSRTELIDEGEVIGAVLRTRSGIKPVYVSIGHKVDITEAVNRVMDCCRGYRIPEPLRLAHLAAGGKLK